MLSRLSLAVVLFLVVVPRAHASTAPSEASLARGFPVPPLNATAAVVMDANSGNVLMSWNAHLHLPMASTTKIMTGLLALELGDLNDRVKVPSTAFNYESDATVMGLRAGETVTLRDLLYGLLLPSGADAANTIAIHYGGSEARFVGMMNAEAKTLGLRDTHYVDATGLSSNNHYSSAYDLAVLGQYVSYMPDFIQISSARQHTWNGHVLTNVNRVLFWYPGVDGIKPGYTNAAGLCQVLDARRDGRHVVVTLLNTPDLVTDARNLLNFGLRNFSWIKAGLPNPAATLVGVDHNTPYRYFEGSGHYVKGLFLDAYQADGGLAVLGYPRTEQLREGGSTVQYFQNGALSLNRATNQLTRVALGSIPLPASTARATPTVVATPHEKQIPTTRTPTPTPRPRPTPTASATVTPTSVPVASQLSTFVKKHGRWLGAAVSPLQRVNGYVLQTFRYGALVYDTKSRVVLILPLGDRLLTARHFLPSHPGNAYPSGFAPASVLKAVHWLWGN